jgi:hypothetical protein
MSTATSFAGLILAFALAFAGDRWTAHWRAAIASNSSIASFLFLTGIGNLILAGALLLLGWYMLIRARPGKLSGIAFILAGLIVNFGSAVQFTFTATLPPLGIAESLSGLSYVTCVAAFAVMIGSVSLVGST